jgi:hypothetical protein
MMLYFIKIINKLLDLNYFYKFIDINIKYYIYRIIDFLELELRNLGFLNVGMEN